MDSIINYINSLKRIVYLTVICTAISAYAAFGQQLGQFTQYVSNELVINPAYAGADEALSLTFVNRSQWSGIEGAPSTQTFSGHSLFKKEHIGLGMILINDKIGIHSNLSALGIYSYRLRINRDAYFSMGIQLGINHKSSDYASLTSQTQFPNDPTLSASKVKQTSLELGSGIYFKSPKLQVGLSAPKLFPGKSKYNDSVSLELDQSHYFLLASYLTPVNHNIKIQPGFLIKYLPGLTPSLDINFNTIIKDVLLFGVSYRSFGSINSILQAKVTPQLKFGYSFDFPTAKRYMINRSSHELMVKYIFEFSNHGISGSR